MASFLAIDSGLDAFFRAHVGLHEVSSGVSGRSPEQVCLAHLSSRRRIGWAVGLQTGGRASGIGLWPQDTACPVLYNF